MLERIYESLLGFPFERVVVKVEREAALAQHKRKLAN